MKVRSNIKIKTLPEYAFLLKNARQNKKMKQTTLAKQLGISAMGVSHFEQGTRLPRIDFLEKWANALGLEIVITLNLK